MTHTTTTFVFFNCPKEKNGATKKANKQTKKETSKVTGVNGLMEFNQKFQGHKPPMKPKTQTKVRNENKWGSGGRKELKKRGEGKEEGVRVTEDWKKEGMGGETGGTKEVRTKERVAGAETRRRDRRSGPDCGKEDARRWRVEERRQSVGGGPETKREITQT